MIVLTFDGAVNLNNYEHYKKIFNKKRQNPNGCDIRGTFFISHEYRWVFPLSILLLLICNTRVQSN